MEHFPEDLRYSLLMRYGNFPLAYSVAFQPDLDHFGNENGFLSYKKIGRTALVLADPLTEPGQREALIDSLLSTRHDVGFWQTSRQTSLKLDLLDAMSIDPRLKASDFRVAFRLIQHRNATTGLCNPSQETLADETGLKPRTVRQAIKRLEKAKWISHRRPVRNGSNQYVFSEANVNAMLDRKTILRDARADVRRERHLHAGRKQLERH